MNVIKELPLGSDNRPIHLRFSNAVRALRFDRSRYLRTDITLERIERLAKLAKLTGRRELVFPTFDYGLALVTEVDFSRFELHAEAQDVKLTEEERLEKIRGNLGRIQAPNVELIRLGSLDFGSGTIRESEVVTDLPASWEALEEIISPEFPQYQFIPDLSR